MKNLLFCINWQRYINLFDCIDRGMKVDGIAIMKIATPVIGVASSRDLLHPLQPGQSGLRPHRNLPMEQFH